MPALSLRLSEELEQRLDEEARREGVPRSEVARLAISDFIERRERERFMSELVAEAREAYASEGVSREAREIADDLDAAEAADAPAAGDGERWWK